MKKNLFLITVVLVFIIIVAALWYFRDYYTGMADMLKQNLTN